MSFNSNEFQNKEEFCEIFLGIQRGEHTADMMEKILDQLESKLDNIVDSQVHNEENTGTNQSNKS